MQMDPLSRVLIETHLRGSLLASLELAAPWALDFGKGSGVPIHYIIDGTAWLHREACEPVPVIAGDLLMFPRWGRHILSSSTSSDDVIGISDLVRRNGRTVWSQGEWLDEPLLLTHPGDGSRTSIFSMVVELQAGSIPELLAGLPDVVHLDGKDAGMGLWLEPTMRFLTGETADVKAGYAIVQSRLAELLFMQIVRSQLLMRPEQAAPSIRPLLYPPIARSLDAMRDAPERRWTLAELARNAGMSRSAFATRFLSVVDTTPFAFLRDLRLDAAARRLRQGARVKEVVDAAGYATQFSFAKAFGRRFGMTPGAYRRHHAGEPQLD